MNVGYIDADIDIDVEIGVSVGEDIDASIQFGNICMCHITSYHTCITLMNVHD